MKCGKKFINCFKKTRDVEFSICSIFFTGNYYLDFMLDFKV
jgi:hypothetical protein